MPTKPAVTRFFAPVIDGSINALRKSIDQKMKQGVTLNLHPRKLTILSISVVVAALFTGCAGGQETRPVAPEPNATLTGAIEITQGASGGTISLTISGDGASLTSTSVTLSNLQCDGFSAGSMTKTAGASIPITEGSFHGSVTDIGEIEGEFTSSTKANGTISLMLEIPYFGTCDLGTWNWSAQKGGAAPDHTPPTISSISATDIGKTSATITWTTNEPSTSQVEYGETPIYGATTSLQTELVTSHSVALGNLNPDTTYHFRVKSKDDQENEATSEDRTFTTLAHDGVLQLALGEALGRGLVEAGIFGDGLTSIKVELESMTADELRVLILPGTMFEAQSAGTQNMVVTEARDVLLISYGSETLTVPAACANMELSVPYGDDPFTLSSVPAPDDLVKLLGSPGYSDESLRVKQFAVWTITENPNCRSAYRGLTTGWSPFSGSGPSEEEMGIISDLFEAAGISVDKYPALGGAFKQAEISEVSFTWDYWSWGYYSLESVEVRVRNETEFPVNLDVGELAVGSKEATVNFSDTVLPGEEKTISGSPYLVEVTPGAKAFSLEILDECDVVVCSYSGTATPAIAEETQFELTSWSAVDYNGTPSLQLSFTTSGDIDLILTNPDGIETDSERIYDWDTETKLNLAGYREVPLAGQYTLTAKDALGKVIATEIFDFLGVQATISNVSLTWDYYYIWGSYSLESISFTIRNDGDLPAYICEGELGIDIVEKSLYYLNEIVLPGEEKTVSKSMTSFQVTPGEKTMSLELRDNADKVVCLYSSSVTPAVAEQTSFELTDWTVMDYLSRATLQVSFTTTGDVELVLTNPDGIETDSTRIYNGFKDAKLDLAGYQEVPDGGQYTLTVKDAAGATIATETFGFVGPQLTISEVSLTWRYWEYSDKYSLEGLSFKVANNGDLPAYITSVRITLDGLEYTSSPYDKVLPGEEKDFDPYVWISNVPPGAKTFTMELLDSTGKVIASYSTTVTPSE